MALSIRSLDRFPFGLQQIVFLAFLKKCPLNEVDFLSTSYHFPRIRFIFYEQHRNMSMLHDSLTAFSSAFLANADPSKGIKILLHSMPITAFLIASRSILSLLFYHRHTFTFTLTSIKRYAVTTGLLLNKET